MKKTMQSLKLEKPFEFSKVLVDFPDVDNRYILVEFKYAMLCGSDYPKFSGSCPDMSCPLPHGVPIHECIGEVVITHSEKFKVGDLVLSMPKADAGLSEYFISHESHSIKLEGWDEHSIKYATLSQPTGTVLNALDKMKSIENKDILMFGLGSIGYIFALALHSRGASNINVVEPNKYRALAMNGVIPNLKILSCWDKSFEGSFDLIIDAVGQKQQERIINLAISSAKPHAHLILFGIPTIKNQKLNVYDLIRKNLSLTGVINPHWSKYLCDGVNFVKENLKYFKRMLTHEFPLSDAQSAFRMFGEPESDRIKILLYNDITISSSMINK
jgi:threonine dehydrogenase-like Zn-dependent dehydrogenase